MFKTMNKGALGSDAPRSLAQLWARRLAQLIVGGLRLNTPSMIPTEIVQSLKPVARIDTDHGPLYCRGGHGRLVWRARSFFREEPETIRWLDQLQPSDVLWDIGANVGLYGIYAAKFHKCPVFLFEPEAQNYAILIDNILLNEVEALCVPAAIALGRSLELGRLRVRYVTKGGAFNLFLGGLAANPPPEALPESFQAAQSFEQRQGFHQVMFGCSVDELVEKHALMPPTHLKIDVDGLEPHIIEGALQTLQRPTVRGLLIEINTRSAADMAIPEKLNRLGFRLVGERSNWESRRDQTPAAILPAVNMIFAR